MLTSYMNSLGFKSFIYSALLFVSSLFTFYMGLKVYLVDLIVFIEWEVYYSISVTLVYTILVDWISLSFISTVMLISSMVLIYSHSYMAGDKIFNRFIILVYLFVLSMILMVMSPNLVSILMGWDGLGLVSYALVGIGCVVLKWDVLKTQ